ASADFPTRTALQPSNRGGPPDGGFDAFVTELGADGSALVYSTYLGGRGDDRGQAIAVDASGAVYVAGSTASADFPVVDALQPTGFQGTDSFGRVLPNAFVTKVAPGGQALAYSTYLGGTGADEALGLA